MEKIVVEDVLIVSLFIVLGLAVPCLLLLACRGWFRDLRRELPVWRSILTAISAISILFAWFWLDGTAILWYWGIRLQLDPYYSPSVPFALAGILSAFALRRIYRLQMLLAGVIMVAQWRLSYVT